MLIALDEIEATRLSWWLAGLTTAADWIGSNADWFPARAGDLPLADYLALAREAAARHVPKAGVAGSFPVTARFSISPCARCRRWWPPRPCPTARCWPSSRTKPALARPKRH
ncbi:HD domain-containing protein [Paenirhodobacter sp.]|uniref:HD domain-containing protein n=1 Tax=Paenirhodobacter sp. TaxID=1965326 RepID=UPI003B3C8E2D